MNPIEHYPEESKKINMIRETSAEEEAKMVQAAEEYLRQKAEEEGKTYGEILKEYYRDKDYQENINPIHPLIEPLSSKERKNFLLRAIYMHEVRPQEQKKTDPNRH